MQSSYLFQLMVESISYRPFEIGTNRVFQPQSVITFARRVRTSESILTTLHSWAGASAICLWLIVFNTKCALLINVM